MLWRIKQRFRRLVRLAIRVGLWGALAAGLLAAAGSAVLAVLPMPKRDVQPIALQVHASPERLAEGQRLVGMLCRSCHFEGTTGALAGRPLLDVPRRIGLFNAANITRHPEHGIGKWSEGDIAWLLRTGVHPHTAQLVPPMMPRWPKMATDELESIVAFMVSDHAWTQPAAIEVPASTLSLRAKLYAYTRWNTYPYPTERIERPDDDPLVLGAYLVESLLQCYSCHAPTLRTDTAEPRTMPGYLGGGAAMRDMLGGNIQAANITPHATGIEAWSERDLARALLDGFRPDGTVLRWPMHRYYALTEAEVGAIYAFLRAVPPVASKVARRDVKVIGEKVSEGKHVYQRLGCRFCHGELGTTMADLTKLQREYPDDESLVAFLDDPSAKYPDTVMPRWKGVIAKDEYAPLVAYVRELGRAAEAAAAAPPPPTKK